MSPALTEERWQQQVLDLARLLGWRGYHTRDSRRSAPGFPDLVLLRGPRLVVAELKTDASAGPTQAQREWLDGFAAAGAEAHVWRPRDLPLVREVLAR